MIKKFVLDLANKISLNVITISFAQQETFTSHKHITFSYLENKKTTS